MMLNAAVIEEQAGGAAQCAEQAGALAFGDAALVADDQAALAVQIAITDIKLGIEEDMIAAPVGIAGQHVPLQIGRRCWRGRVSITSPE